MINMDDKGINFPTFKERPEKVDIDMDIQVRMNYVNKKHVPSNIYYKGYWNVLFLKPERVEFFLKNTSFQVN